MNDTQLSPKARVIAFTRTCDTQLKDDIFNLISYCARVSNQGNKYNENTAAGLVAYLEREKHWSPFEMVNIVIEINTERDIGRQVLRHRSFTFQEFSQRYAHPEFVMDEELRPARRQDIKNRQNSIDDLDEETKLFFLSGQRELRDKMSSFYHDCIDKGIAKECARTVLAEGLTKTTMIINGSLRSWLHYLPLRMSNGTQLEHMLLASSIHQAIVEKFPDLKALFTGANYAK